MLRRLAAAALIFAALVGGALLFDRLCPPDLARLTPSITVVDRHGALLRAFPTADGQWRLPVDPASVSPDYVALLLATEDRRFFRHPGVDPLALMRAAGQLVRRGRVVSGGSTLTMQLARLLEPRQRTLRSKLAEIIRAVQIERRMGKAAILRAYLTLTPMGGNLEGVRSGSLAWFGVEPRSLAPTQAALLVALPQAPGAARPDRHPERARALRRKVLAGAVRAGLVAAADLAGESAAPLPVRRLPLPRLAPHLSERLAADAAAETSLPGPVRTTLDAALQGSVERALLREIDALPSPVGLAAMIVDRHTGAVLARAGSAAYADAARRGAVDMTLAVRSPGSTLKPFIYGLAFDALLAHPGSLLPDEPTRFDDYAPHDFDGTFRGDVTVRRALQMSLNLPAVIALSRVGPIAFTTRFRDAGLPLSFDDGAAPSLPLALGGTGMTLERLVTAYRALGRGGRVSPLVERYGIPPPTAPTNDRLLGPAAADAVVDILAGMPPPKGIAREGSGRMSRIAFKTGTSYRFRDGWAIGFDEERVAGVWVGRADGGSCRPCLGASAAAVLFHLFDLLPPRPLATPAPSPFFVGPPPPALARLAAAAPAGPAADAPRISFPLPGARLLADAEPIRISAAGGRRPYRWSVDGRVLPSQAYARGAAWHPDGAGFVTLDVVDADGRGDTVRVRVLAPERPSP